MTARTETSGCIHQKIGCVWNFYPGWSVVSHLLSGVSLAWLGGLDWEQDELGLVLLQTLDVQLKSLDTPVAAPHVHADPDGLGLKEQIDSGCCFKASTIQQDFLQELELGTRQLFLL